MDMFFKAQAFMASTLEWNANLCIFSLTVVYLSFSRAYVG